MTDITLRVTVEKGEERNSVVSRGLLSYLLSD